MQVNFYPLARSVASYILPEKYLKRPGSGGTFSSKYCYSVWLRHMVQLFENKLINDLSQLQRIAEIGPGDSLGIGMAAMLSGAKEYYAFDVIEHANLERNVQIAKDLARYFSERLEIPHKEHQFRNTKPDLNSYEFPATVFDAHLSNEALAGRLSDITKALRKEASDCTIEYVAPWYEKETSLKGGVDLIFSQAVMEHVEEVEHAYGKMYEWLKPGGIISHQIDYKAHEMTKEWNGHWYIDEGMWKFLLHGRKYSINRLPHSAHIKEIEKAGFAVKNVVPFYHENTFGNKPPKVTRCEFEESDMTIAGALIQAVKP